MADGAVLEFADVGKWFATPGGGRLPILEGLSFQVRRGQFTAMVGPSGCGKTTLLHLAAGLVRPSAGEVRQDGARVAGINRRIGYVTQQANLFPWKTLRENVEFALVLRGMPRAEREARVAELLAMVGLAGFEAHYPHQLSGGMQKRAAIARTLAYAPEIVLMDEPFGALDAQTRMLMQRDLLRIAEARRMTILFVTHDLVEAVVLADNVILLGRRPARIKADVPIALARPRDVFEPFRMPGFTDTYERVWSIFKSEMTGAEAA